MHIAVPLPHVTSSTSSTLAKVHISIHVIPKPLSTFISQLHTQQAKCIFPHSIQRGISPLNTTRQHAFIPSFPTKQQVKTLQHPLHSSHEQHSFFNTKLHSPRLPCCLFIKHLAASKQHPSQCHTSSSSCSKSHAHITAFHLHSNSACPSTHFHSPLGSSPYVQHPFKPSHCKSKHSIFIHHFQAAASPFNIASIFHATSQRPNCLHSLGSSPCCISKCIFPIQCIVNTAHFPSSQLPSHSLHVKHLLSSAFIQHKQAGRFPLHLPSHLPTKQQSTWQQLGKTLLHSTLPPHQPMQPCHIDVPTLNKKLGTLHPKNPFKFSQ